MLADSKIWKWYQRHSNAIDSVLDIACGTIPGSGLVIGPMRLMLANWRDKDDLVLDEKHQEVEKVLKEVKPILSEIVEEIEDFNAFTSARSQEQRISALQQNEEIRQEIQKVLPQLSQSISFSISKMQKNKKLGSHYEIGDLLGKGGQAEVRRGRNLVADRPVAIKMFPKDLTEDSVAIAKLKQEYGLLVEKLVHENIVQYRDLALDEESSRYFVVMDIVEGKNLRNKMLERGTNGFSLEETVEILTPVAKALDFAHERGIVHRDLKPENIMIRNSDGRIYLTDFGLASEIRTTLSRKPGFSIDISGTLPYMAPEQYLGHRLDGRTDNWALGVIIYEMVEGIHPFNGTTLEHYMKLICELEPEPPERLEKAAWQILQNLFKKDRKERREKACEVLQNLLSGKKSIEEKEMPKNIKEIPIFSPKGLLSKKEMMALKDRKIMDYDGGIRYEGQMEGKERSGYGIMTWPSGEKYEGYWKKGKRNGYGVNFYTNGQYYEGEFIDDQLHGYGKMVWPSGEQYEGNWKNDKRNGQGTNVYVNKQRYEGNWKDDIRDGQGIMTWPSGERYEGNWKNNKRNGQGINKYANGQRYEGNWKDDVRDGEGTMTWPGGERYEGRWKNDRRNGYGINKYEGGHYYEGEFVEDKLNGQGIMKWPSGEVYEGQWKNDRRNGYGINKYVNGTKAEGIWEDDRFISRSSKK
ncbi:MAG: protein kinase [Candidatus Brocadiae bacterium]|nr:protein kinase [Candidatus Brocadiia bacterium]